MCEIVGWKPGSSGRSLCSSHKLQASGGVRREEAWDVGRHQNNC